MKKEIQKPIHDEDEFVLQFKFSLHAEGFVVFATGVIDPYI